MATQDEKNAYSYVLGKLKGVEMLCAAVAAKVAPAAIAEAIARCDAAKVPDDVPPEEAAFIRGLMSIKDELTKTLQAAHHAEKTLGADISNPQ